MRTTIPWKPNTSGLPDPFFDGRREYLEHLNALDYANTMAAADRINGDRLLNRVLIHEAFTPQFDPDAFHPVTGYIVPISQRSQFKESSR